MIKKTVAAGIAALAVAGVLGGAALTGAAQADTRQTPTTVGDVTAQYSKGFNMFNVLGGYDLRLAAVDGLHEGAPPIGSSMSYGQFQRFEVQYDAYVDATYDIIDPRIPGKVGTVMIEMEYGFFGNVNAHVVWNHSTMGIVIDHPGDETWGIQPG